VLDAGEVDDDLVRDMVEVLTSFCARLYGRRSARNRARKPVVARSAMSGLGRLSVVGGMMAAMDELRGKLPT
jgi:putative resolvase